MKKKGLFGKIVIAFIALAVIGTVFGRHDNTRQIDEKTTRQVESSSSSEVKRSENVESKKDVKQSDVEGTWRTSGIVYNREYYSYDDLESMGETAYTDMYFVLYPDGTTSILDSGEESSGVWSIKNGTVMIGTIEMSLKDGLLYYKADDLEFYFERISSIPMIPASYAKKEEDTASESQETEPNAEKSGTESTQDKADVISPELKEFLDSYEAFMDEYCASSWRITMHRI